MSSGRASDPEAVSAASAASAPRITASGIGRVSLAHEAAIRIGAMTIEPSLRRIAHHDGRELFVEPRVMQLLVALAKAKGHILSRDDLTECCWEGRIVGDDAINRVISRARQIASTLGADSFRIDTIPRVGFRLMPTGTSADPGGAFAELGSTAGRRRTAVAASIAIALLLAGTGWWLLRPSGPADTVPLAIGDFPTLSAGLPPTTAGTLKEEIRANFGPNDRIRILVDPVAADRERAYRLSGSVHREPAGLRFIFHLAGAPGGSDLWTGTFSLRADGQPVRQAASLAAGVIHCVLVEAGTDPAALPETALALWARYCELAQQSQLIVNAGREAGLLREAIAAAPDFVAANAALALIRAQDARLGNPAQRPAAQGEATRLIARTLRLDPDNAAAWSARSFLLPWSRYREREAFLRRAVQDRSRCPGCVPILYTNFLMTVGKYEQAAAENEHELDIAPLDPLLLFLRSYLQMQRGQTMAADRGFDELAAVWPTQPTLRRVRLLRFLRGRDFDAAAREVNGDPSLAPELRARQQAFLEAVRSGDPARRGAYARQMGEDLQNPQFRGPFPIAALAFLGQDRQALEALERLWRIVPFSAEFLLYQPEFRSARQGPDFARLVERMGLLDYWRQTGGPDFCREADPPAMCAGLRMR